MIARTISLHHPGLGATPLLRRARAPILENNVGASQRLVG